MENDVKEFLDYIKEPNHQISKQDYKHLIIALNRHDGIANFYYMPKVHKDKILIIMRPVVAIINATMRTIGKLVASWLKPLSQQVSTFLRDSDHLIQKLQQ